MVSTNPSSSAPSWSAPAGIGSGSVNSISCPSTTLCVAVGVGEVVTSTDPTGGALKWTAVPVDGTNALEAVSCPTMSFCEAVDSQGNSVSSPDPTGGSSKWTVHPSVDTNQRFRSLSCPSISLCVAVDTEGDDGHIATSTGPASDTAWKTVSVEPAMSFRTLWGVSCPSISLCVVVDDNGYAFTSTQPTGDAAAWSSVLADGRASPTAVSCSGPALCTLVDTYGNAYVGQLPPPNTTITHATINHVTHKASFAFTATGAASGFQCELRRAGHAASFSACSSPKSYANLPPGNYTFLVRAFNQAGPDPTPASTAFKISALTPPKTKITGEAINQRKHSATFRFKAIGTATGFRCAVVKLRRHKSGKKPLKPSFSSCKSPKTYKPLKHGKYTFEVRALSAGGAGRVAKKRFKI